MDRLDKFSIVAIIMLLLISLALMTNHMGEARSDRNDRGKEDSHNAAVLSEIEQKVKEIKALIEGGKFVQAEVLTKALIQENPGEGEPRIIMGDIFMRKQEPVMAVLEYKKAIDINPDYLDRQTHVFQGKKMEIAVKEALTEIERDMGKNPEDALLKKQRKNVYYLQRRLAGGCS